MEIERMKGRPKKEEAMVINPLCANTPHLIIMENGYTKNSEYSEYRLNAHRYRSIYK